MMKATALALLIISPPAMTAQTTPATVEEILVVVNNHIITRRAFQQQVEQQFAELYRQFSGKELDDRLQGAREKTLQEMIDNFVLLDIASEKEFNQYAPTETEILNDIKSRNRMTDADLERAVRSELGMTLNEFARQQVNSIIIEQLLGQEVYRKVPVEDQEARLYYNEHQSEFQRPARFRIREMIIPKGATDAEQTAARERVAGVLEKIKDGTAFESLVQEHSANPSRGTGGDIGWVEKGLLLASIENAALALKPDEVSDVIETDKDLILIQLIASELEGARPFNEVREAIFQKLRGPKAENALMHYLQSQRIRANIRYMVPKEQIIKG